MSGTGLSRFGIRPPSVVRGPAREGDGTVVCPECGHPVGGSKGTQIIHRPTLVDDRLDAADELITHGWACEMHVHDLVLPARAGGPDAPAFIEGWVGVRIVLADGRERYVPVPEKEVGSR